MITTKLLIVIAGICCLQLIPVNGSTHELVAAWKEIQTNTNQDVQQTTTIYNKLREEQRAIAELRTIVDRRVKDENVQLLTNALMSPCTEDVLVKLRKILQNIYEHYDKTLIENIFDEVLKDVGVVRKMIDLPDILWRIYKKGDEDMFQIMLIAQLQLYDSYRNKFRADEKKYAYKFAYYVSKIKEDPLYKQMPSEIKAQVKSLQDTLPNNVKYLFFAPYFCLQNIYHWKYMYTAVSYKIDSYSRYVWLWYNNNAMDDTAFIKAEIQEYDAAIDKKLKVALKSTKYNIFYYMMPSSKTVAGWDNNSSPSYHIWDVDFLDSERVALSQNDVLMCATSLFGLKRRNVEGRAKAVVGDTLECKWRLGECIFVN